MFEERRNRLREGREVTEGKVTKRGNLKETYRILFTLSLKRGSFRERQAIRKRIRFKTRQDLRKKGGGASASGKIFIPKRRENNRKVWVK